MDISQWLDGKSGRTSEMALHFGLTPSAVSQWRTGVPYSRMHSVEIYTGGQVTVQEMLSQRFRQVIALRD